MEVYARLRERLDVYPPGATASETMDRILKLLFSPEEAEIACYLTYKPQSIARLTEKSGRDELILHEVLEALANRGLIKGEARSEKPMMYSLFPVLPGFMEFSLMRPDRVPHYEELTDLWKQWMEESYSQPTPLFRIIPIEESLPIMTEVVPFQQVNRVIENADYISVAICACRAAARNCDHPLENCLNVGHMAKYMVDRGLARHIERDEAMRIIEEAEKAGMVHSFNNSEETLSICNCCSCSCGNLRGLTVFGRPNAVAASSYMISFNREECIGCWACTDDRCPVGAITPQGDMVAVNVKACIGCGLCTSVCPTEALVMVKRDTPPGIPKTGKDLMNSLLEQTGRTELLQSINRE